jgi:hypothetical protein
MASGYVSCACRDCFDIAIASNDESEPAAMCGDCEDAGCEPDSECQRDDAYGVDDNDTTEGST